MTIAMPRPIWLPMLFPMMRSPIARIVVSAVIRIGRMRVFPVAMSASRRRMPPSRSWLA